MAEKLLNFVNAMQEAKAMMNGHVIFAANQNMSAVAGMLILVVWI